MTLQVTAAEARVLSASGAKRVYAAEAAKAKAEEVNLQARAERVADEAIEKGLKKIEEELRQRERSEAPEKTSQTKVSAPAESA